MFRRTTGSLCSWMIVASTLLVAGCGPGHKMLLPPTGAKAAARVSLDTVWEMSLLIESQVSPLVIGGGAPAPQPPHEVVARCLSPICKALVLAKGKWVDMRLAVVGLQTGPADVEVRYRAREGDDWDTLRLRFEFVAAPALPQLRLGDLQPRDPFTFDQIPPEIAADGVGGPARCEHTFDGCYCFGRESFDGRALYPSCSQSDRCSSMKGGVLFRGFRLHVGTQSGRVIRIESVIGLGIQEKTVGLWGHWR